MAKQAMHMVIIKYNFPYIGIQLLGMIIRYL